MILNMVGGGGAGLNFTVVGGTSQPSSPSANTIWVNTSTSITSWIFSVTQPAGSAGMVWFKVGTSSTVQFNALKKNNLQVYPLSVKQYVSGAWVDKTAKTYQGGKWVEWRRYLYNSGDKCTDITGGYTAINMAYSSDATAKALPSIAESGGVMTIKHTSTSNVGGAVRTGNKIDLTNFSKLYFDGKLTANSGATQRTNLSIWSAIGEYRDTNRVACLEADNTDGEKTLDISGLKGTFYIGFFLYNNANQSPAASVTMRKMWLA